MESNTSTIHKKRSRTLHKKPGTLIIAAVVVLLGAAAAVYFFLPKGERIDRSGYQVVYMVNGQAYFGKLQNTTGDYLVIKEPYSQQQVQSEGDNEEAQTTLLKVSQQQYGPNEVMSLKSDQVLFWQNLRDDSKVATAIESDQ